MKIEEKCHLQYIHTNNIDMDIKLIAESLKQIVQNTGDLNVRVTVTEVRLEERASFSKPPEVIVPKKRGRPPKVLTQQK